MKKKPTIYTTNSTKSLQKLGAATAKRYAKTRLFLLRGQLGAGKTTFAQGLLKGFGVKKRVVSPTFSIINLHKKNTVRGPVAHIDFYRIKKTDELAPIGIFDLLSDKRTILVVEWPERFPKLFSRFEKVIVAISASKGPRKITIRHVSPQRQPAPKLQASSKRNHRP